MRPQFIAGGIIVTFLFLSVTHGAAYLVGRADEAAEHAAAQAASAIDAGEANTETSRAVADAADNLGRASARLQTEAAHGRREIEAFDQAPALGRVGADALVDARLARRVLCRIERVRSGASAEPGDCSDDPADREPAVEPVPAGTPP